MASKIENREVEFTEEMEYGILKTSQLFDEIWKELKMRKNARQATVISIIFVQHNEYFKFQFDRRQEKKRRESLMKIYREMVGFYLFFFKSFDHCYYFSFLQWQKTNFRFSSHSTASFRRFFR